MDTLKNLNSILKKVKEFLKKNILKSFIRKTLSSSLNPKLLMGKEKFNIDRNFDRLNKETKEFHEGDLGDLLQNTKINKKNYFKNLFCIKKNISKLKIVYLSNFLSYFVFYFVIYNKKL